MSKITFKGQEIEVLGSFLHKGDKAHSFTLVDDSLAPVNLEDIKGTKFISIVPSLDTSVCLTSAKKFNEKASKLSHINFLIISADLPFAQKRVCGAENLKNIKTLSTLGNASFAKDYGVLINTGPLKGLCARAVIILDEQNNVLYSELVREVTHEPDYDKAFEQLS